LANIPPFAQVGRDPKISGKHFGISRLGLCQTATVVRGWYGLCHPHRIVDDMVLDVK